MIPRPNPCPAKALASAFAALSLAFVPSALAQKKGHTHKAHSHGHAKLSLVAEGNKLTATLESPADSIYGFEHEAKKPADMKTRDEAMARLKSDFPKMVALEERLGCTFAESKVEPFVAGSDGHGEVRAEFVATCKSPLAGSQASFGFSRAFRRLKKLEVIVLSGDKQTGAEIRNDKGSVTF
jgi:hypothetical protein